MSISAYIEKDLIAHISGPGELPAKLTLSALAGHYDVSLTPVRVALDNLVDQEYILKGNNGRLNLNPKKTATRKGRIKTAKKPPTLKDWDTIIAEDIILQSINSESSHIREESTAERYGVGRTVIRQVFNRLAGADLIERVPRRGWRVHPFREQDMLDYIHVREILELEALKLARSHLVPARLKEFIVLNSPGVDGKTRLDNGLHEYWIEKSGNRYLRSYFAQFGIYYSYLFAYSTVATSVIEEKAAEHRRILNALLKKNWESANKALSTHIRSQRPNVTHLFEQLSARKSRGR
jgi:DNA-binding GntR family transcriptional regulator